MKDVLKIQIPQDKLAAMTPRARAMFLLLGHASNQVSFFTKLLILSTNKTPDNEAEQAVSAGQSMMLLRTVIGVLHEAYLGVVTRHFLNSPEGRGYVDAIGPEGKRALGELRKLFGGSGLLARVRNDYAFHHPKDQQLEAAYKDAASSPAPADDLHWYMAKSGYNSFYHLSEVIVIHGMLRNSGITNLVQAQAGLMVEVRTAHNEIVVLLQELVASMWRNHVDEDMQATVVFKTGESPDLSEFWLPCFFDVPDEPPPIDAVCPPSITAVSTRDLLRRSAWATLFRPRRSRRAPT